MEKKSTKSNKSQQDEELVKITNQELTGFFKGSRVKLDNPHKPKKYSKIFHEFLAPAIDEVIDDEEQLKEVLDCGQAIWNRVVSENFPDHPKSINFGVMFTLLKSMFRNKELIEELFARKDEMFADENFFIVKQTALLHSDGRLAISVAVLPVED